MRNRLQTVYYRNRCERLSKMVVHSFKPSLQTFIKAKKRLFPFETASCILSYSDPVTSLKLSFFSLSYDLLKLFRHQMPSEEDTRTDK